MEKISICQAHADVNPARRFESIQANLEDVLLKMDLKLSDPQEKEIYDHLSTAIDKANTLAISAQDYFNSRA